MPGLTFEELQSNLDSMMDRIYPKQSRHITPVLLAHWINAGYHELDRKLRWTRGDDSITTAATVAAYDLDETVCEILAVQYTDTGGVLSKLEDLSVEEYVEKRVASDNDATPTHYVHHGAQLLLYPTPAITNETVKVWAVIQADDMDEAADYPTFPAHLHEFILDLALAYAARHLGDTRMAMATRQNVWFALEYEKKQPAADRGSASRVIPSKF